MTLGDFLDTQCRSRGWRRIDLYKALASRKPDVYKVHQRVYSWFTKGGISPEAALDVAELFKLDSDQRQVFAKAAGFEPVMNLLNDAA